MKTKVDVVISSLLDKLVAAGFVETSFDGYGVYPDQNKLAQVLSKSGLAELLEAGWVMRNWRPAYEDGRRWDAAWKKLSGGDDGRGIPGGS